MDSDHPGNGGGPRGTIPLGLGPFPSPTAPRDMPREGRATAPMLPSNRRPVNPPQPAVEPQRRAQLPAPDAAHAPRSPALRAPLRLAGEWRAPSWSHLAQARLSTARPRLIGAALAAAAIVVLAVTLRARSAVRIELPAARALEPVMESAASAAAAERTAEPPPTAAPPLPSVQSASRPAARPPRGPQAATPPSGAHAPSDVVDPWRH
jgi:hypothetical protein